ncbi:galactose oxidase, partial [Rhizophagus irregularis]
FFLKLGTKEWTRPSIKGVTPLGRYGHSSVLIGSIMYVFGGCIDDCYLSDLVAFDTKFLDLNEGCWEFIDPINDPPPGRTGHISCAYKGRIYIFGGTDGERCFNDIWYYDIETREWVELICDNFAPVPRESHGAALANDVIYIFGGRTRDGKELSDLAAYGINNERWYMFQKMGPSPGPRYWLTVSSSKNIVMVFGGTSTSSTKPDEDGIIHILDTCNYN